MIPTCRNRAAVLPWVFAVLAPFLFPFPAQAEPPQVESHELDCGDTFPCPPEIRRRVDFWIKVFRSWGTDQLIFHDRAHPARAYSVITSEHSCRRARSAPSVEAERDRVEEILRTVAKKLTWAEPSWTAEERAYLALFPDQDPDEIAIAANRVRCQQGNRHRFQQALRRYGRYKNRILEVLREHNLSEDLLYLPFVESAYNPEAYSSAGAAGLWQIMPATARTLGLQLDATMDERFDPDRATWAAAKYLRNSTDRLTSLSREIDPNVQPKQVNPFVITSYNYGVTGMARAIRSVGPDYIEVLNKYRSRSFRTAVRNFYASFLAARYVARNADKYFGPIQPDKELAVTQVVLDRPTSVDRIVDVFGLNRDTVERLNPALTRYIWKGWRLIPAGYALKIPSRQEGRSTQIARLESLPAEDPQLSGRQYVVQRGDTACEIASAFAVACKDLIQLNGLGRRALIRVGQELDIPGAPKPTTSQRVAAAEDGYYKVRRGDSACEIARSFSVDCKKLIRTNNLGERAVIHIGQQLRIPGLADEPEQVATADGDAAADTSSEQAGEPEQETKADQAQIAEVEMEAEAEEAETDQAATSTKADAQPSEPATQSAMAAETEPVARFMEEIDLAVQVTRDGGSPVYRTRVLPEETLGHYADWLGLGGTGRLRDMNGIPYGTDLRLDTTIKLPIEDESERLAFEASRFEYHQTLVDEFNQHYDVTDVKDYTVKLGDTMWKIARRHGIPYWVLSRTNKDVGNPVVGQTVRVPIVQARNQASEPLVETN